MPDSPSSGSPAATKERCCPASAVSRRGSRSPRSAGHAQAPPPERPDGRASARKFRQARPAAKKRHHGGRKPGRTLRPENAIACSARTRAQPPAEVTRLEFRCPERQRNLPVHAVPFTESLASVTAEAVSSPSKSTSMDFVVLAPRDFSVSTCESMLPRPRDSCPKALR